MLSGLVTESRFTPRSNRARHTDRGFAFTAAVRVIAWVHDDAADGRTNVHVTFTACFTERNVAVTDLTDGSFATDRNVTHFAAWHSECSVFAFLSHKLCGAAGSSCDLAALSGLQFDVVDHGADRDIFKRQAVAHFDVRVFAAYNGVARSQAERSENVSLFAVGVNEERNVCGTVRIVLNAFDFCRDTVFVTFEIDDAVLDSVAAADVTVMRPVALRPPDLFLETNRLFSGFVPVISLKVDTVMKRRAGEVGLYLLMLSAIFYYLLSIKPDCRRTRCSCCRT